MNFVNNLKTEAHRLGFILLGITTPDTPDHFRLFRNWLDQHHHASMAYLSNNYSVHSREHPASLLPECKSIIVLGYPYKRSHLRIKSQTDSPLPKGSIAAYAIGEDYHTTISSRQTSLINWIENELGQDIEFRRFSDSGAVLERDLAQRAGIGWIGKNSCLISREHGSFFFLSEIFLNIPLEPNTTHSHDFCGTCHQCIDHCPTKCILPDRTIDANRCISYLTIENKGPIPVELRPLISNMVFGCDICQNVCPWNKKLQKENFDIQQSIPEINISPNPDLNQELSLSSSDFHEKYGQTAINRAKRKGYLRNVAVALGNLKYSSSLSILIHCFEKEKEPLIRSHIAWALGQYNQSESISFLKKVFFLENHPEVKSEILSALSSQPGSMIG